MENWSNGVAITFFAFLVAILKIEAHVTAQIRIPHNQIHATISRIQHSNTPALHYSMAKIGIPGF
jgi:hypothetical protein